jgi:RNA polymerase sigma factor (sigma-70 family)
MARILPLFKTEHDMARAIIKGDGKAQRAFYEKFSGKFLGVCCRYIKDRMAAEDVMIESMMRIFEKSSQFDFQGSYEGWSRRLVVNQALGYLRSQKMLEVDVETVVEVAVSQETHLEESDLLLLIQELPSGYRTVFNLYAIEGYSHAEISELLGISEGTSKSQLSRARAFLQERLKKSEFQMTSNF